MPLIDNVDGVYEVVGYQATNHKVYVHFDNYRCGILVNHGMIPSVT